VVAGHRDEQQCEVAAAADQPLGRRRSTPGIAEVSSRSRANIASAYRRLISAIRSGAKPWSAMSPCAR
jgi:hypothetical protein